MTLTLESFNAMVKARDGKLPVHVVHVTNVNRDEFNAFVRENKSFYESFGLTVEKKDIVTQADAESENTLVFTMIYPSTNTYAEKPILHFDLRLEQSESISIKRFIKDLCLEGLTEEKIKELPCYKNLVALLMNENDYKKALISTLEQHFCTAIDNQFVNSDFDWCEKDEITTDDTSIAEPTIENNVADTDNNNNEDSVISELVTDESSMDETERAGGVNDNFVLGSEDSCDRTIRFTHHSEECNNDETFVPTIPEPSVTEVSEDNNKETLTAEEVAENAELLKTVRTAYEECKAVIEGSCNSLFIPIKNRIKTALETNDFSSQLCLMYLEVSQDTSSPVYKKVYETDKLMEKFNNGVHRQTLKMGCPGCGHQWYEDITFLEKGIHEIHCPKCNISRLIEK